MITFAKALTATAVPIVAVSIASIVGVINTSGSAQNNFASVAFGAAGLWVLGILAAIGFAVARKGEVAAGILAGVGIGIVALGATCFAVVGSAF